MDKFSSITEANYNKTWAKGVLRSAESKLTKLEAFLVLLKAEYSIEVLQGGSETDVAYFESKYQKVEEFKSRLTKAAFKAAKAASQAFDKVHADIMVEHFNNMPEELKAEMSATLSEKSDWEFLLEY